MQSVFTSFAASIFSIGLSIAASAEPSITIGTLAELSGPYARLGDDCRKAFEVAKQNAPESTRIIFGDHQSDPKTGISEFRRMVGVEHASLIVTTRSPVGLALNPLSREQKIPLIGVIGHPRFTKENRFAVRVYPSATDEAQALSKVFALNGERSVATISIEDEYFLGLQEAFEAKVGHDKIVFSKTIAPTDQDFATILAQIKDRAPSAIFLNVGPAQHGPLIRRIHEMNMKVRIYSNFLIGAADFRKGLGTLADGILFVETDYNRPNFLKALEKQSGSSESSPIGYGCYVGLSYALQLSEYAASKHVAFEDAIREFRQISTLDERIEVSDRKVKFNVVAKTIRDGKVEPY